MVKEARNYVSQTPWALYFPAAAIATVVIGVNLMADGLKWVWQGGDGGLVNGRLVDCAPFGTSLPIYSESYGQSELLSTNIEAH